jgi:5'-nucleotidase
MKLSEKIMLVDMDGTLCDYDRAMTLGLNRLKSPAEDSHDIYNDDAPPYIKSRMDLIKLQPGWWRTLPTFKLGFDVLEMGGNMGFERHVLTKGPFRTTSAWTEKVEWCRENLPKDVKITITEDKGLVYGRVLVDDYPEYMLRWLKWRPRGVGIMPLNKGNADFKHPNVVLYDGGRESLTKVVEMLNWAFDRKSGE